MQVLRPILFWLSLAAAPAGHGATIVVSGHGASAWWLALLVVLGLQEPYVAPVSPHHIMASPPYAQDSCTFVAGVRHCPLPPLGQPR